MKKIIGVLMILFLTNTSYAGQWTIGERTSAFFPDDDNFKHKAHFMPIVIWARKLQ